MNIGSKTLPYYYSFEISIFSKVICEINSPYNYSFSPNTGMQTVRLIFQKQDYYKSAKGLFTIYLFPIFKQILLLMQPKVFIYRKRLHNYKKLNNSNEQLF